MNLSFLKSIAKFVATFAFSWLTLELLAFLVAFNALFPLWAMALIIAIGFSFISFAYHHEASLLPPRRARLIISLRCLAFLIVCLMLLQPVLQRTLSRKIERTIAVLIDSSDSMRFTDSQFSPSERLSLAYESNLLPHDSIPLPTLEPLLFSLQNLSPWLSSELPSPPPTQFRKLLRQSSSALSRLQKEFNEPPLSSSTNTTLIAAARSLNSSLAPALNALSKNAAASAPSALSAITDFSDALPSIRAAADDVLWASLPSNSIASISSFTSTNRLSLALSVLTNSLPDLPSDYSVQYFSLGRNLRPASLAALASGLRDDAQSSATSYATALEEVLNSIPSEQLAGILLLSDGLDNGDATIEPIARRLGSRGIRVSSVFIGAETPPRDLAIADISAPESIFLGDKVRVNAKLSATQARGSSAHISLLLDGLPVDETTIPVSEDLFARSFSLSHSPTNNGLAHYELRIDPISNELFPSNNSWKVDVAVSDDRTHVLLVDDFPRWDFRYLRNLFFARDKSVHLQYLLLHPDSILDVSTTNQPPPASASRPFGDAEAGSLPANEEEWRKFDAIIIGDVGPDVLTPDIQKTLLACAEERGSLLVFIAGPRAMPHAFPEDAPLRSILPCTFPPPSPSPQLPSKDSQNLSSSPLSFFDSPEPSFKISLTPAGRLHPVTQQSSSASENDQIWSSLPPLSWRFPVSSIKPGAEIIAFATPSADSPSPPPAITAANALESLEAERFRREQRSLIVAQNLGRGKVIQLNTDESWRLRYRIGDTRHHRFWGQIIRWGLGERLRTGTQRLRIGTERLSYTPNDPIRLLARVLDEKSAPVHNARLTARVSEIPPTNAPASFLPFSLDIQLSELDPNGPGLYEATLPPLPHTGAYQFSLLHPEQYSGEPASREISTLFFVAAARRPIEMASVAASPATLDSLAKWTGGRRVAPHETPSLADSFGEKSRTVTEPFEIVLWDNPWLFLLLSLSLFLEWILRKRGGLV